MAPLLLILLAPPALPSNNPVPLPNPFPQQAARPWQPGVRPPLFPIVPIYTPIWGGFGFYPDPLFMRPVVAVVMPPPTPIAPPNPDRADEAAARAAAAAPATLSLEFPAPAEVWLDGLQQSSDVRSVASPALRIGESYTFRIRARWIEAGTTYETEQTSTVKAGERGKLAVYAGKAVK